MPTGKGGQFNIPANSSSDPLVFICSHRNTIARSTNNNTQFCFFTFDSVRNGMDKIRVIMNENAEEFNDKKGSLSDAISDMNNLFPTLS